jgi:type IV pilus assembly protein PilW
MKHQLTKRMRQIKQAGFTLVELMVAMVIVSVITLVCLALYVSVSSTYRTTDANQELQDNARFTFDVFSLAVRQAGLQDSSQYALFRDTQSPLLPAFHVWDMVRNGNQPALFGANNAKVNSIADNNDLGTNENGGVNNSDVFGVRFFGASLPTDITKPDNTIINCRGNGYPYPLDQGEIGLSLLQVATSSSGEPELQCISKDLKSNTRTTQPIVSGVESLQLMYAVDTDVGATADTTPNRWLNAKEVTDAAAWPKVRTVRVGMVLRGAVGSAAGLPPSPTLYPLGEEFSKVSGSLPTTAGMAFTPPNDNRLRRVFTFNISTRNTLEQ